MKSFTVHMPPEGAERTSEGAGRLVFVREGFNIWALLIPVIWMLYRRMWLPVLGYLAVVLAFNLLVLAVSPPGYVVVVVAVAFAFYFAFEANQLRRWSLERKGWHLVAVVNGAARDECEEKLFSWWLGEQDGAPALPRSYAPRDYDVIGMFPNASGR